MPLFRWNSVSEKVHKTSSLHIYGQGRSQTPPCGEKTSSLTSSDENRQPFLAFAEVTYDPFVPMRSQKSRLSKTLVEVLQDNAALAYFIQFMDHRNAKHLVKFWMEAEGFHSSASTRLKCLSELETSSTPEDAQNHLPLLPSDSSECISDHSDDVYRSSRQKNCDSIRSDAQDSKQCSSCIISHKANCESGCLNGAAKNSANSAINNKVNCNRDCDIVNNVCPSECLDSVSKELSTELKKDTDVIKSSCDKEVPKTGLVKLHTSIEQDAKAIYKKYIGVKAECPIGVNEEIHNQIKSNILSTNGKLDPNCFHSAQEFVVKKMDDEFFPSFLRSTFHCKHQIDVLTSGNVFLADVLYNDSALFYFMEFVEQENVRHLVDFLLMADNFQKHLISQGVYDGIQAQNDAMIIYDKYFSLQATSSLGFSDAIRYEVEHNICQEDGPKPDCFSKPVMILTQYIEKTYLLQFLNSQLYFKYISECIITIQTGSTGVELQPKPGSSESGSEQSLPIAKPSCSTTKVLKNIDDQDMRIDTGQFNPDALWQRPLAGKLLMAHIDKLGRVVTEFEPEPDKRKESMLSKAMKKFVNRDDDKQNQEDMAWKIAEMIVSDICSVTMANQSDLLDHMAS